MDFTGVPFSGTENIIEFNANGHFGEDAATFGDLFPTEVTAESFSTVADSFTTNDSFATAHDFTAEPQEHFHNENGEFRESCVILTDGADHYSVSTTVFDSKEELVWTGNQGGHVTSYLSSDLMKYTSFQAHSSEEIRDLCSIEPGILCLTPTSLQLRTRQGIRVFSERSTKFENLQCMLPLSNFHEKILIGGHQQTVVEYDLNQQDIVESYDVGENGCVILREHPRFVCHGNTMGNIILHDPRTLRQEHSFQAHSGALSDFDVQGNYIITCGFSNRMGQMMGDQFVMVYDMRMMKMSLPCRSMVPPYFIRFMPGLSSCLAAVSLLGQWLVMDAAQPENTLISMNYHVSCSPDSVITSFDISSSSQALVFGDSVGSIHLFTTGNKSAFNNFSLDTILPVVEQTPHAIPLTDLTTSLGSIPLDYTNEPLLSDWPIDCVQIPYWPTPPIDPQILQSMRLVGSIGYAPNTLNKRRNEIPYKLNGKYGKSQFSESQNVKKDEGPTVHVPRRYRRIEIKYNKMGADEFDFDSYNRTNFSGLDMSLPNSYCNAVLQVFYYIAPLRAILLSHLCEREFCLACELGFLFHMLDIGGNQGIPCHSSNFLRAFRTIPEASAMSLTISDQDNRSKINFASKIQSWNCFVLQQIHSETLEGKDKDSASSYPSDMPTFGIDFPYLSEICNTPAPKENTEKYESSPISDVFGAQTVSINKCTRCGHQTEKDVLSLTVNLSFSECATELSQGKVPFSTVVQSSMCLRQITQAWCDTCSKYQPIEQFRRYKALPSCIAMNCGLDSAQDLKCWQTQYKHLLTEIHQKMKVGSKENVENNAEKEEESHTNTSTAPNVAESSATASPARVPGKIRDCRYGAACVRVGCKFWHPLREKDDNDMQILSLLDQTMDCSWIPFSLTAVLNEDGTVTVTDSHQNKKTSKEDKNSSKESKNSKVIYDLQAVVSHISDPKFPDKNNLVACVKIGPTYHQRANVSPVSHWYLLNDISIVPIKQEEAVWFPCSWKTPCVLYWIKRTLPPSQTNIPVVNPISVDVFKEDKSLAQRGRKRITFTPLTSDEMPTEGDFVAMDAEFVNLHQEEAEIRSDGTRTTIKPSQKSVGRITCIRGFGPLQGTAFLDDYISTQEQVVDYLTQFSGIKPGDLDANYSQKHLTTLKSTYVKLRYLVDNGVKIVGHGLKNDLRVINLVVPQTQLIDTVHLFHLPHNRMVSLKFLAWHFLKVKIQSVTHDSIEDARTALALYHKYLEIKKTGNVVIELQKMYDAGKKAQWKVPGDDIDELTQIHLQI